MPGIDWTSYGTPRADLGQALWEYYINLDRFIGPRLYPLTPVTKKAAKYGCITRESILRQPASLKRAAHSAYNRDGFETEDKDYSCEEYGEEVPVDYGEVAKYASDFDAEMAAGRMALHWLMLDQERRVAAEVMNVDSDHWDSTDSNLYTDVSTVWSSTGSANVITDIDSAKDKVVDNCGMEPNTMVLSRTNRNYLKNNTAQISDRYKYVRSMPDGEFDAWLADILGFEQVLVGRAVYNSAKKGQAFSKSGVWSNSYVWVGIVNTSEQIELPSAGRTFTWAGEAEDGELIVEQYDEDQTNSTVQRVRQYTDEKTIDPHFAHVMKVD